MSDDAGADGVEVDVSEGGEEVRVVKHAGEEAALPEAAATIEPTMEILGILAREVLHEPADGILDLAGDDEVNVVRHDGVTVDADLAEIGVVVQESEKLGAVLVAEEDRLAIVAALGEVEWVSGRRESGFTGHPFISGFRRALFSQILRKRWVGVRRAGGVTPIGGVDINFRQFNYLAALGLLLGEKRIIASLTPIPFP